MSSFILLKPNTEPKKIGNPTFKILLINLKKKSNFSPLGARIIEMNPIAESIGFLNLESIQNEGVEFLIEIAENVLVETQGNPMTESGFNIHQDMMRFIDELKKFVEKSE